MPSPCLKGTTSTRLCIRGPLFGEHKLAACEIPARLRKQDRDLKGKGDVAINQLQRCPPNWVNSKLQQRLIKEGVETAVGDSQRIAQLTTAVFTAAFEPVKKRIEAVQNAAHP